MTGARPTLGAFVLRAFLWLPVGFAAWHAVATIQSAMAAGFARLYVAFFNASLVKATELHPPELLFVTTLPAQHALGAGVITLEVNTSLYTYGLAIFLALMLASRARWWHIPAGAAALLPFQGWGIGFDFLAHVGAKLGPEVAAQAGLLGAREFIALAYQLGNLVFPSVAPVALWVFFNRAYVESLSARHSPVCCRTDGTYPEA